MLFLSWSFGDIEERRREMTRLRRQIDDAYNHSELDIWERLIRKYNRVLEIRRRMCEHLTRQIQGRPAYGD